MTSPPNLAEILGKINDGICVWSPTGEVLFVNEKASEILAGNDQIFRDRITEAQKNGSSTRFEHFHEMLNRRYEHHAYPNADGGLTLVSCDITSRHRIEEALRASEERFRRVIESNIIGVIVVENGVIIESNDVFLQMVNQTRSDLMRKTLRWREMTPPEFEPLDAKARLELESKGGFAPYEKDFLRKGGGRVPVLVGGVVTDGRPDSRETLCLVLDLSERRRAEKRVHSIMEAGKILASSLECETTFPELAEFIVSALADSCVIVIHEDGQFIRMTATHSTPLIGEPDLESAVRRVMTTGKSEIRLTPSRILVPITAGTETAGVLAVASRKSAAFDIEDLHLFEVFGRRAGLALENSRLYHEAQKANQSKDEFVAIISHELRTPLTPILGGVYMMRNEPYSEKAFAKALDLIERNAKTQVRIVDDLLDVSRALSGKLRLKMETLDLAQVIGAAIETVRPASEAKNISIEARLSPLTHAISGDADRLQQVIWNLLANSVKFTPKSGRIIVELVEDSGHAEIRVTDTGIGIEAGFLPHVFEKFRQADVSRTRLHGGLGLGLTIVRHLVESHGGTVQAHNSDDESGATFVVRLPLPPAAQAAKQQGGI